MYTSSHKFIHYPAAVFCVLFEAVTYAFACQFLRVAFSLLLPPLTAPHCSALVAVWNFTHNNPVCVWCYAQHPYVCACECLCFTENPIGNLLSNFVVIVVVANISYNQLRTRIQCWSGALHTNECENAVGGGCLSDCRWWMLCQCVYIALTVVVVVVSVLIALLVVVAMLWCWRWASLLLLLHRVCVVVVAVSGIFFRKQKKILVLLLRISGVLNPLDKVENASCTALIVVCRFHPVQFSSARFGAVRCGSVWCGVAQLNSALLRFASPLVVICVRACRRSSVHSYVCVSVYVLLMFVVARAVLSWFQAYIIW